MHWLRPPFSAAQPDDGMGKHLGQSFTLPSSFRLQMEGLASQYEYLHAFSQSLIDQNTSPLDHDDGFQEDRKPSYDLDALALEVDHVGLDIDADIPRETVPLQIVTDIMGEPLKGTVLSEPPEIPEENGIQMLQLPAKQSTKQSFCIGEATTMPVPITEEEQVNGYPFFMQTTPSDGSTGVRATSIVSHGVEGPRRISLRSSGASETSVESYASDRRPSYDAQGLGGLFPKWFDPGIAESAIAVSHNESIGKGTGVQYDFDDEELADSCTISPVSTKRLSWDFLAAMCLLIELWITPFELVFLEACDPPQAFEIVSYTITGFFSCDIVLNFFTGFVEGDKTIMSRNLIFWQYVRFWFWIDLAATIPLELLLNAASGGAFSVARLGKASKVIKTFRYLKLLRVARLLRVAQQAASVALHFKFLDRVRQFLIPAGIVFLLAVYSHIHGCIWAMLQPEWVAVDTPAAGLKLYFESFWWAYTAITTGSLGYVGLRDFRTQCWGVLFFEMIVATERLFIGVYCSTIVMARALRFIEQARTSNSRTDVLTYLRQHKVSFQTQIQVMFCLTDASRALMQQRFYKAMYDEHLPMELHRTISAELWNGKLMSLGLIAEISSWHVNFTTELAQSVREETLPSKAVLFTAGDPALAAYYVIEGELIVKTAPHSRKLPNFKIGMWVGENALASSYLRCPATFVTANVTSLMVVPGESFGETLSGLGLTERFQQFCGEQLWRGLCGRCGILGDHFSDNCKSVRGRMIIPDRMSKTSSKSSPSQNLLDRANSKGSRIFSAAESGDAHDSKEENSERTLGRDLQKYLAEMDLSWIGERLLEMQIYDLQDLEYLDPKDLRESFDVHLSAQQEHALSATEIGKFRNRQASDVHRALFASSSRLDHLIFLSHYKVEAGTEAALLRTEIEQVIAKDPGSLGNRFEQPVFLDSDDLSNLEELKGRVCHTHNLVLLLTKGVLTRPWCVIEILTAWREGVRVQPVTITKPGNEFQFPDEAFYTRLRAGHVLDMQAMECIKQQGFNMKDVELAIQNVFQQIAVPYSPHKAGSIRRAEVDKLMKNCRLKGEFSSEQRQSETKKKSASVSLSASDSPHY